MNSGPSGWHSEILPTVPTSHTIMNFNLQTGSLYERERERERGGGVIREGVIRDREFTLEHLRYFKNQDQVIIIGTVSHASAEDTRLLGGSGCCFTSRYFEKRFVIFAII